MSLKIVSPPANFIILTNYFSLVAAITTNQIELEKKINALKPEQKSKAIEDILKTISTQLVTLNQSTTQIHAMCSPKGISKELDDALETLTRLCYVSSEHASSNRQSI